MLHAAQEETAPVFFLAASFAPFPSPVVQDSHLGHRLPTAILHLGFAPVISNTATEFGGCLYDFGRRSRSTGKERDAETGLDWFESRYYSAAQGRFTSPDEFKGGFLDAFSGQAAFQPGPLPYADISDPQTLNKYAYVRNNPLRYTDPNGHCFWDLCIGEGAAAYAAGTAAVAAAAYLMTPQGKEAARAAIVASVALVDKASNALGSLIFNEQGRDAQGKFVPTNPGDTKPGSEQEAKGLDAVGATKNTKPIPGSSRIPDGKTESGQYVEVKSGTTVSGTKQINEAAAAAQAATGKPLVVVVNPGTTITRPVRQNPNIKVEEHPLQ